MTLHAPSPVPAEPIGALAEVPPPSDYPLVRAAIEFISAEYRSQPSLDAVAEACGVTPQRLEAACRRWAS